MSLAAAIERIQKQLASIILVYKSHDRWPLPHNSSLKPKQPLQISVLDSSFNPPTLAHKALINSPNPFASTYDANLLLLSVRNADKSLKPGDASHVQRLEMMSILAKDMPPSANIAVAICDQPNFIGKSKSLRKFFQDEDIATSLTFLVGFDTLERILSPRYYASEEDMYHSLRTFLSPESDNSRIVCARRPSLAGNHQSEDATLAAAKEFIDSGRVALTDIGETENLSSTKIRNQTANCDAGWRDATIPAVAQYILDANLYIAQ